MHFQKNRATGTVMNNEKPHSTHHFNTLHPAPDECIYCGHCTRFCQMSIDIAHIIELYDRALADPDSKAETLTQYKSLRHNANDCIRCNRCERICPFEINITERMEAARNLFR